MWRLVVARALSTAPRVVIPPGAISLSFVKSSGPGGQHVNKTSSACEGRLSIRDASWLSTEVKARLLEQQKSYCNDNNELIVHSQEERSQHRNRARVLDKIQDMINQAAIEPKLRELDTSVSEHTKRKWIAEKKFRSELKASRKTFKVFDY